MIAGRKPDPKWDAVARVVEAADGDWVLLFSGRSATDRAGSVAFRALDRREPDGFAVESRPVADGLVDVYARCLVAVPS